MKQGKFGASVVAKSILLLGAAVAKNFACHLMPSEVKHGKS